MPLWFILSDLQLHYFCILRGEQWKQANDNNNIEYVILFCCLSPGCILLARCYQVPYVKFTEDKVLVFIILHEKNAKIVQLLTLILILTLISIAD